MQERIPKKAEPLAGVKCVVNSCYYHEAGDYCTAAKIEVQPRDARNTEETDCATFIVK